MGFNGQAPGPPVESKMAWVWLASGGTVGALCDANVNCGTGGGPVMKPPGVSRFAGDPWLVTDRLGHLVYMNMALGNDGQTKYIVAGISLDGGRTIRRTVIVNENKCNDGEEDQPAAAFDTTVNPPELWVVWRHRGKGAKFGACFRHGHLNLSTAGVDWALASTGLDEASPVTLPRSDDLYGIGAVTVQAGDGAATIVSSGSDNVLGAVCPGTSSTGGVTWFSTTTTDGGLSWHPSVAIMTTSLFEVCTASDLLQASIRDFAFVRDDAGRYYAALNNAATEITVWQSEDQGAHWRLPARATVPAGTRSMWFPTLASAAGGHVALSYYATDSTDKAAAPFITATHDSRDPSAWEPPVALAPFVPIRTSRDPRLREPRLFGDYMGMAAFPMESCTDPAPPMSEGGSPGAVAFYVPVWTDITRDTIPPTPFFAEPSFAVVARVPPP